MPFAYQMRTLRESRVKQEDGSVKELNLSE